MPWDMVECHPSVRKAIVSSFERNMLMGTSLIYGPPGAGQDSVARAIALTFVCTEKENDFCGRCINCVRVQKEIFPDVFELYPWDDWSEQQRKNKGSEPADRNASSFTNKKYGIDHMRIMHEYAQIHPYESEYKIFVLHHVHRMTLSAANNLLKILEEPFPHNIFLLVTDNYPALLPTILSRCRKIRLAPMPVDTLAERLAADRPTAEAETLARAAGGLPEQARHLIENGYLEMRDELLEMLKKVREKESYVVDAANLFGKEKERLRERLTILLGLLRDGVLSSPEFEDGSYLNPDRRQEIDLLWQGEDTEKILQDFERVLDAIEGLDRNLNATLMLTDLFMTLRSTPQSK